MIRTDRRTVVQSRNLQCVLLLIWGMAIYNIMADGSLCLDQDHIIQTSICQIFTYYAL